ncbi:hypothetical protein ACEWB4_20190 [Sphingobium sp. sgz301303]
MTKTAHTTERATALDEDEDRSGSGVLLGTICSSGDVRGCPGNG